MYLNFKNYLDSFTKIDKSTWSQIEKIFHEVTINKGEHFAEEGQIALKIGFLQSGVIRAYYVDKKGKEYNKHFFIENSLIGAYSSLISGQINCISQQALTDYKILIADYKKLTNLYNTCPDLERFSRKYAEFSFVNKEKREIEIVLLSGNDRYEIFQKQFPNLSQLIPQYHIASYLGISATQLSRIRKKISQK